MSMNCPLIESGPLPSGAHRPGGLILEEGSTNWGTVCLFVRDQLERRYALTARHVAGDNSEGVLGKELIIPKEVGCGPNGLLKGKVVSETSINWEFFDAVLVKLPDSVPNSDFSNVPYGSKHAIERFGLGSYALDTPVVFFGAKSALRNPAQGFISTRKVTALPTLPAPLPNGYHWIEFYLSLQPGDSGGLFTSVDGKEAIAMLQLGRLMGNIGEIVPVYGVELSLLLEEFKNKSGHALDGYANLELSLLL